MIYMTRCKIKHNLYWNKDFHQMDINVSTLVSYNLIFIVAISIDISEHFLLWKQIKKEARNDQARRGLWSINQEEISQSFGTCSV